MEYLKVWVNFREVIQPLKDEEKGRLFDAMLRYAEDCTETKLTGNEQFVWPSAKQSIDRTREHSETYRKNGLKGGRPRKEKPRNKDEPADEFTQEMIAIQREHDEIFDAMENAGFEMNNTTMTKAIDLYASYGKEAMIVAIDDCAEHGAKTLAYLRKVLEGGGGKKKAKDEYNILY